MKISRLVRPALALALFVAWLVGITTASERSAKSMAAAANKFLAGLSTEQRQQASFAIDSPEWTKWHFIPTSMFPRNGLPLKSMSEEQRGLARELLKAGLSQRGFATVNGIIDLEIVLKALETNGTVVRDPELYFFSVFGTPGPKGAWGWRVEGHHLSLHWAVADGKSVVSAPSFFGSNPAEVREGPKQGTRVLGPEEDSARALLDALDPTQKTTATLSTTAPGDIVTMTKLTVDPLAPAGLTGSAMTPPQRELLMRVIEAYTTLMTEDIAAERIEKLKKAGIEKVGFAWSGEYDKGKKHYYRVQGPTFLIEYDNTQNNGNHVHSVWRDFEGDFGRDVLRDHIKSVTH